RNDHRRHRELCEWLRVALARKRMDAISRALGPHHPACPATAGITRRRIKTRVRSPVAGVRPVQRGGVVSDRCSARIFRLTPSGGRPHDSEIRLAERFAQKLLDPSASWAELDLHDDFPCKPELSLLAAFGLTGVVPPK